MDLRESLQRPLRYVFLKDTFEAFRARARRVHNLREFYRWSVAAGLTGLLAGLGAILFVFLLDETQALFETLIEVLPSPYLVVLVPAFGGLLVGIIRWRWAPEAFDVSSSMDAMIDTVHSRGGRTPLITPFITMVTASITLGSGGSAGREGPTAYIGAGLGSLAVRIIEWLRLGHVLGLGLGRQEYRTLAICGAAAGLGAIFRAPIGASLFACSVLYMYGMEIEPLLPALVASVTSYLVFSGVYGFESLFHAPFSWSFNFFDFFVVVVIGVTASLLGVAYVRLFYGVFRRFRVAENVPDWLKPAIGGLVVGVIALWIPQVWGMGYETIQAAINYELTVQVLLLVIVGKAIASSFTIGSGGAGGDMAPALFIGACIGGVMGSLVTYLFPDMVTDPTLYVIAGMGAFYASIAKVPLATAILLSESTRNFTMIMPLMVANTAGFLAVGSHTIYESQHADAVRERADVLRQVPVGEICRREVVLAPAILSIQDALRLMGETGHHGFPVVDDCSELIGVVSWSDMRKIPYERRRDVTLGEICTREVVSLTPDASSRKALDLLDSRVISRIVIVDPEHPRRVYGIVTKEDVIRAYAARLQID